MIILGVDFGGSFIKSGLLLGNQNDNIPTPTPSTPENVFRAIKPLVDKYNVDHVGFAIPCVVKNGRAKTSTNVDYSWQTTDLVGLSKEILGVDCLFLNDADAALLAELNNQTHQFDGLTIMLTFGTGIGAAMSYNGTLIPNMEFGRMPLYGGIDSAEHIASGRIKTVENLSWEHYAERLNLVLYQVNDLFQPDNIIIGGGITDNWYHFDRLLKSAAPIRKAELDNNAGWLGAAVYANGFFK